ncbi:MAG: CesT family type III secretion system chaperone [Chitinophagaceae bacterium]|nr:CesT family type III secretion system chaperone [Rubrivivax sp.]
MTELAHTQALLDELWPLLGLAALPLDARGGAALTLAAGVPVTLFGEAGDQTVLVVLTLGRLPPASDYAATAWLFKRNIFDSRLAPFVIAADAQGDLLLWSRLPLAGLSGKTLAAALDTLGAQAIRIRAEAGLTAPAAQDLP